MIFERTDRFVRQIYEEIETENFKLFESHALIKAQSKDYVREGQIRLILQPLVDRLNSTLGKKRCEKKLRNILSQLHETHQHIPGYQAGNLLNLLIQLNIDLRGYDFSNLVVWPAYFQNVMLPEVNFSHADLTRSVFTSTFGNILSVAVSPDGKLIVAGTSNGEIWVWDAGGTPRYKCEGHTDWVRSVAFSPDGHYVVSGSDDQSIRLWDVSSGECLKTLQGHSSSVWSIAFNLNGNLLASSSDDRSVIVWDVGSGECLRKLQGHTGRVWSVAFSPDSTLLVSGSEDRSVCLWEVDSGQCLKTMQEHTNRVCSVTFSPDGKTIASGSHDGTIKLWDDPTGGFYLKAPNCCLLIILRFPGVWMVSG